MRRAPRGVFVVAWLSTHALADKIFERPALIASLSILLLPIAAAPFGKVTGQAPGCLVIIAVFVIVARALAAARPAQVVAVSQ